MSDYYGNSLSDFTVDQRVSIHPATDLFMQGDVYGTVTLIGRKYVSVKFDRSQKVRRVNPDLLKSEDKPEGYMGTAIFTPTPHDSAVFETPTVNADPRNVARWVNFHRINSQANAHEAWLDRRTKARRNGYDGPLTRAELAARAR